MNSQRKEDRSLELHSDVPSAVKEAWVLKARSGLVLCCFGIRLTRERLAQFWWLDAKMFVRHNCVGRAGQPDELCSGASLSCVRACVFSLVWE